jgi:hypothetical protein
VHDQGRCDSHHTQRRQCPLRCGAKPGRERSTGAKRDPRHQGIWSEQLGLLLDGTVWGDHRADPTCRRDENGATVFDRANPGDGLLLVGHLSEAEGGIVRRNGKHLGARANALAHQVVKDHLVAGRYADADRSDVDRSVTVSRYEIARPINVWAKQPEEISVGYVFPKGLYPPLVVALPRPGPRIPHDHCVGVVPVIGAQHSADQDWYADRTGCLIDHHPSVGVP